MMHVMIVEDEAPIQRSLKMIVESTHDRVEVVASAYNGKDALELLKKIQPDVIITDIRMPIMNGLEFAQEVRILYPDIQIILLSGYREFDYAQQAMKLGVIHYLVKPVSKSQIKKLLDVIYAEILLKKKSLYKKYVAAIINGEPQSDFPLERLDIYGAHLLLLFCAGQLPVLSFNDDIPGKLFWEQQSLHSIVAVEMGSRGDFSVVNGKSVAERWVMLSFFNNQETVRFPAEWAEIIANRLGADGVDLSVSIVYSRFYSDMRQTADFAQVLRSMLYKKIIFGFPIRFSISDGGDHLANPSPDPLLIRKLSLSSKQQNIELVKTEITSLINKWKLAPPKQIHVEQWLTSILESLLRTIGADGLYSTEMLELDVHKAIMHSWDYESLSHYVNIIIESLFSLQNTDNIEQDDYDRLVNIIEKYLQEHYTEEIDQQMLADKFGLVPSYLSKIFAKYKGISPAKYIVKLRIDAAQKLLLEDPELLAKDITYVVGYSDPNYFSRIFKRETGLYPSEFREKNGKTDMK